MSGNNLFLAKFVLGKTNYLANIHVGWGTVHSLAKFAHIYISECKQANNSTAILSALNLSLNILTVSAVIFKELGHT